MIVNEQDANHCFPPLSALLGRLWSEAGGF
jgi:hypothetical protein